MLNSETVQRAIEREAESNICARGDEYFRHGNVKKWSAAVDSNVENIFITGDVRGEEMYSVILQFNIESETFTEIDCTCPYYGVCKHTVAVALMYAHSLKEKDGVKKVVENERREFFPDLNRIDEFFPRKNVEQQNRPKPFVANDYYIVLRTYSDFSPQLFNKSSPHQSVNLAKFLTRDDITPEQHALVSYMKDGNFGQFDSKPPELEKLFPLIVASGFSVYRGYYSSGDKSLQIELLPEKLKAEISYEPLPLNDDIAKIQHNFYFKISKEYWKGKNVWHDKPFTVSGSCAVREKGDVLELHCLTKQLAGILSRLTPEIDYKAKVMNVKFYQALLTGEEIASFEDLVADAKKLFSLSEAPKFHTEIIAAEPTPAIQVTFDGTAQTLQIAPVIDYGIYQVSIAESVHTTRRTGGKEMFRKPPEEQPGNYIVVVEDNTILLVKVDEEKEISLFQELEMFAEDLGFTKTLKCSRQGAKPVAAYLHTFWPVVAEYADKHGYPIIFKKDSLAHETAVFHADFSADMNAENDWLHFDVDCYCGDEKVTLKKLAEFMQNKQPFWRKNDGTLVEISNPKELERLVRLLQSFNEREEGSYEGKLHHTAELQYVMTSSEHYNAQRSKALDHFLNRMQEGKPVEKIQLPAELEKILRPYQKAGIEWLYFLRSFRFAGILADDMGLGKTLQALAILDLEKVPEKASLVVCPKTLLYNWKMEAEKFFPNLKVLVYDADPKVRKEMQKSINDNDLVVVSYGTVRRDEKFFSSKFTKFNYVLLDEAQFIKNHVTKNAQIVKKLNADYRLALTGTPMENSVSELWSIYDFLMPGFLGNYEHFSKHFHRPIMDTGDRSALEHLRRKVGSFMLRRTKSEVLTELPPKIEQMSQCHLSESQNILYQQILAKVRGDIFETVQEQGFKKSQIHILAGLTKLRQACNHPALLTKDKNFHDYESAKLDMCMELVEEVAGSGRKVLIFSQFTGMLDIVAEVLKERGISHVYLSGKTKDRQAMVNKFNNDPTIPVFLISLKAGGTGLNLTSADTVIVFDPWWNPSVENQAIDRAHRIGQTKTVNVYRLLTSGTIEDKIQILKQKKQGLFDAIIDESGETFNKLTWDDVKELFEDTK
jgi:SNF2 family DNA or RNA helicase